MNPSSTSSSERRYRLRRWAINALLVVAIVGGIELVLRIPAVEARLPIRTLYHETGVVVRLDTLTRLLESYGRMDVLFVGSSVVRCNINPSVFDSVVGGGGEPAIVSFNAGLSGFWPASVRLYLEDLWLPRAKPSLVVQGIRFAELFPSKRARRFDRIVTGVVESAWEHPGPLNGATAWAFETFRILQYRGTLPSWLMRWRDGVPAAVEEDEVRVFTDSRGWTPRTPTLDVVLARQLLRNENPNPRLDDRDCCRDALEAIRQSARAVRRTGAEYILVNVPEHAFRWSGVDGGERYAAYLTLLRAFANSEGFEFIDVTRGDPDAFSSPREFSDYQHMSPDGARRFTALLAAELRARFDPKLTASSGR
jgi:hypothetical protein